MLEKLSQAAESNPLLVISLQAAVPLWVMEMRDWSAERRLTVARDSGQYIAEHGDVILYRSSRRGESAQAFNALARGIAVLSYQPGGVMFAGQHWCTNHAECTAAGYVP